MTLSLHARLLIAASLVLGGFLGATGLALDEAFRTSSEQALRERMLGHIYALLAAAEEDTEGQRLRLPALLADPRFNQPGSGYYARIDSEDQGLLWRSPSTTGSNLKFGRTQPPGGQEFERITGPGGVETAVLSFGIAWEFFEGGERRYTFSAAQSLEPWQAELAGFRRTLWSWLGGAALLLLLAQGAVLGWGLRPLRRVAGELQRVEAGERSELGGGYPRELHGLTANINSLLRHAETQQARYRNSMDDLAHSLKTPLAVLQTSADAAGRESDPLVAAVNEQVMRMNAIVHHQLGRAAGSGRSALVKPLALAPLAERIGRSLHKVYRDKPVQFELDVAPDLRLAADEADLMELLGNLLDNAWKYCAGRVRLRGRAQAGGGVTLRLEDDGPGMPPERVAELIQRGRRGDQSQPGQGIGLAVVNELIRLYRGRLEIGRSELGGAELRIDLPG